MELLKRLEALTGHVCVIAGGYAADPNKAKDMDIFIIGAASDDEGELDERLCYRYRECGLEQYTPYRMSAPDSTEYLNCARLIGVGWAHGIPVQLIKTSYTDIASLLSSFDLSCHAVAIDSNRQTHTIPETTSTTQPIRILHTDVRPTTTLDRLVKCSARYGIRIDGRDRTFLDVLISNAKNRLFEITSFSL